MDAKLCDILINCFVIILRSTCYCMMVIYFCPHCPTSQIFEMDTLLDHAQELAMTLVEWALTPMGHCKPKEEYIRVIASTNHLEILCLIRGLPLARLPKSTKSCSDLLYEAECSIYTLRALTRQSRDNSWPPPLKGNARKALWPGLWTEWRAPWVHNPALVSGWPWSR